MEENKDTVTKYENLLGVTLESIEGAENGSDQIRLLTSDGREFLMWHKQSCCENVSVDAIDGDIDDLIGSPLVMAEEVIRPGTVGEYGHSSTWTFYKFATVKGYVTIKWLGSSNGYYSESVTLAETGAPPE